MSGPRPKLKNHCSRSPVLALLSSYITRGPRRDLSDSDLHDAASSSAAEEPTAREPRASEALPIVDVADQAASSADTEESRTARRRSWTADEKMHLVLGVRVARSVANYAARPVSHLSDG